MYAFNGNAEPHSKVLTSNSLITKDEVLKWFEISCNARRGFCQTWGYSLFWGDIHQDSIAIVAAPHNRPTGLKTIGHILVAVKSNYYEINDSLPQFSASSNSDIEGD